MCLYPTLIIVSMSLVGPSLWVFGISVLIAVNLMSSFNGLRYGGLSRHKTLEGFPLVIKTEYPLVSWVLNIASSGASGLIADHADTGSLGPVSPASSSSGRLSSPDIIFSNLIKNIFDNLRAVLVIRRPPS